MSQKLSPAELFNVVKYCATHGMTKDGFAAYCVAQGYEVRESCEDSLKYWCGQYTSFRALLKSQLVAAKKSGNAKQIERYTIGMQLTKLADKAKGRKGISKAEQLSELVDLLDDEIDEMENATISEQSSDVVATVDSQTMANAS